MSHKESEKRTQTATTTEISEILGLSKRRIGQLTEEKALVKISRGIYDLPKSIQAYIDYQIEKSKPDDDINKNHEEALWVRARREKSEIELKIMRGDMHRSRDVEHVMNHMLGSFRAQLLSFPTKLAPRVLGMTEIMAVKDVIKEEIFDVMHELSDYDPDVFYARSTDKIFIDDDVSDSDE